MYLYLRWISRSGKYIFFISNTHSRTKSSRTTCKFCLKKYRSGSIVPSKIFFKDNNFHIDFSLPELKHFSKIVLPIYVLEEAIVLNKHHIDLIKINPRELKKSFKELIKEGGRLLNMGFNRVIFTFQSKLLTKGTQAHPQIRIFALKIPNMINKLSADLMNNDYKIIFSTRSHVVTYPFVRKRPIDLVILSDELDYLDLTTYNKEEKLTDLVFTVHKSMLLLKDLPFLGVIDLINEKFYVRIISCNDTEIIWPISAISAASLEIVNLDLDESDLFLSELGFNKKRGG